MLASRYRISVRRIVYCAQEDGVPGHRRTLYRCQWSRRGHHAPEGDQGQLNVQRPGFRNSRRGQPNPASRARTIASAPSATCNLPKMLLTLLAIVFGLRLSSVAIAALDQPWASRCRMSRSRSVNEGKISGATGRDVAKNARTRLAIAGLKRDSPAAIDQIARIMSASRKTVRVGSRCRDRAAHA